MKKLLLLFIPVLAGSGLVNAQMQGYSWYFDASPLNSVPAVNTSAGSYTLTPTPAGAGTLTVPVNLSGGLGANAGASCTGAINVGDYPVDFGLDFSNSPQLITNSYSIEMVINLPVANPGYVRILGFSKNTGDTGIYIAPNGSNITLYDGTNNIDRTTALAPATWYDIVFTRNATTKNITVYVDGVQVGLPIYDSTDIFIPRADNNNLITFFKDDTNEEAAGEVAKLSIINRVLSPAQVATLHENVCDQAFTFVAPNFTAQGYQWAFGTAPYNAVGTDAASVNAASYTLSPIGSGSIATLSSTVTLVPPSASCTGPIDVGQFTKPFGFSLNQSPQFIDSSYTVEMVVNFTSLANPARLFGFDDASDDGVYIDAGGGAIVIAVGGIPNFISPVVLTANTWYHIVVTRDAGTKNMDVYINNAHIGATPSYNDAANIFVPHEATGYNVVFLKDDADNLEEGSGLIAKAGLFNRVLSPAQIATRYDNICNTDLFVLPVTLKNFSVQKVGRKAELTWTTSTELNNQGFEVQRSGDGVTYTSIGFVKGAGNSTTDITYHFTDNAPLNGKSYYRLKQINLDNKFKLSAIRQIDFRKDIQDLQVYPNPTHSLLTVLNLKAGNTVRIFDSFGRFVFGKNATDTQETISVDKLSAGVYVLQVTDDKGVKRSVRFTRF